MVEELNSHLKVIIVNVGEVVEDRHVMSVVSPSHVKADKGDVLQV